MVVLCTGEGYPDPINTLSGVVVELNDESEKGFWIGRYSESWRKTEFKPYKQKVTL
jgi:hypothetical protein